MIGIGLTPEGIEQNDIIYDFMMETTWYTSPVDLDSWISNYATRRYGVEDEQINSAWYLLKVCMLLT
jgi:alpha-N-acetylglucosaminidase